jgi:hypothetical protein
MSPSRSQSELDSSPWLNPRARNRACRCALLLFHNHFTAEFRGDAVARTRTCLLQYGPCPMHCRPEARQLCHHIFLHSTFFRCFRKGYGSQRTANIVSGTTDIHRYANSRGEIRLNPKCKLCHCPLQAIPAIISTQDIVARILSWLPVRGILSMVHKKNDERNRGNGFAHQYTLCLSRR